MLGYDDDEDDHFDPLVTYFLDGEDEYLCESDD